MLVSNLNSIKVNAKGTILFFCYWNSRELTLSNISKKLITTHKHNFSNDNSTSITNLLFNTRKVQKWQEVELNNRQPKDKDI